LSVILRISFRETGESKKRVDERIIGKRGMEEASTVKSKTAKRKESAKEKGEDFFREENRDTAIQEPRESCLEGREALKRRSYSRTLLRGSRKRNYRQRVQNYYLEGCPKLESAVKEIFKGCGEEER